MRKEVGWQFEKLADRDGFVTVGGAPVTGRGGWDPHRDWDAVRG